MEILRDYKLKVVIQFDLHNGVMCEDECSVVILRMAIIVGRLSEIWSGHNMIEILNIGQPHPDLILLLPVWSLMYSIRINISLVLDIFRDIYFCKCLCFSKQVYDK